VKPKSQRKASIENKRRKLEEEHEVHGKAAGDKKPNSNDSAARATADVADDVDEAGSSPALSFEENDGNQANGDADDDEQSDDTQSSDIEPIHVDDVDSIDEDADEHDDNASDEQENDDENEESDESSLQSESALSPAGSDDDDDDKAADYEKTPRRMPTARLPVRDQFGRMVAPKARDDDVVPNDVNGGEADDPVDDAHDRVGVDLLLVDASGVPLEGAARRTAARTRIAAVCDLVVQQPDENVERLRDVMQLAGDRDGDVARLALLSLLAVFRHVLPSYRIRDDYASEGNVRLSKAVLGVRAQEAALLRAYTEYVNMLSRAVARKRTPPATRLAVARALGALLAARPEFNLRDTVIAALVALAGARDEAAAREACAQLSTLFVADADGALSLLLVRAAGRLLRAHAQRVRPQLLEALRSVQVRAGAEQLDARAQSERVRSELRASAKRGGKHESRADARQRKAERLVERDMRDVRAQSAVKQRQRVVCVVIARACVVTSLEWYSTPICCTHCLRFIFVC
jgi:nucleolar complex protein 3